MENTYESLELERFPLLRFVGAAAFATALLVGINWWLLSGIQGPPCTVQGEGTVVGSSSPENGGEECDWTQDPDRFRITVLTGSATAVGALLLAYVTYKRQNVLHRQMLGQDYERRMQARQHAQLVAEQRADRESQEAQRATDREQADRTHREEMRQRRLEQGTDRYGRAIGQLGDRDRIEVRIGGIYALEALASDHPEQWAEIVYDVLVSFLKSNSTAKVAPDDSSTDKDSESTEPEATDSKTNETAGSDTAPQFGPIAQDSQIVLNVLARTRPVFDAQITRLRNTPKTKGANLSRADLSNVNFKFANLEGANLEGAHLEGAHLEGAVLQDAHLEGARLEGVYLMEANLERAHLEGAILWQARLVRAHLEGAHLEGAHLEGAALLDAHLEGAHLEGANLLRAYLWGAYLWGAHLEGASLEGAHLEEPDIEGTDIEGAHLEGAHLEGANLEGAHLSADFDPASVLYNHKTIWPDGTSNPPEPMEPASPESTDP